MKRKAEQIIDNIIENIIKSQSNCKTDIEKQEDLRLWGLWLLRRVGHTDPLWGKVCRYVVKQSEILTNTEKQYEHNIKDQSHTNTVP